MSGIGPSARPDNQYSITLERACFRGFHFIEVLLYIKSWHKFKIDLNVTLMLLSFGSLDGIETIGMCAILSD